jgi:hypothetical protein
MEIAQMIVDYAKDLEIREFLENLCFFQYVFNKNLTYKMYIIPKGEKLIVQYNNLALSINRDKEELKEVIKYFNDMIAHDYTFHVNTQLANGTFMLQDDEFSYEITLNSGKNIIYKYLENSLHNTSYVFDINEILVPLVYLVNPIKIN